LVGDGSRARQRRRLRLALNLTDARTTSWIAACERIPAAARRLLVGTDQHTRLDSAADGIVGVINDLHHDFHAAPSELGVLRFYLDRQCLISARRHPLRSVDHLRQTLNSGLAVERPIGLVTHLLQHLGETFGGLVGELDERVDAIEEAILGARFDEQGAELGQLRRLVARLRRQMVPQRHALTSLLHRLPAWVEEGEAAKLRHAIERLDALTHDLELIQERARLLNDELTSRVGEATSRNLYLLSIVTVIFMPLTFITGIFGMNLAGMPGAGDGNGFWWGLALMAVIAAVTFFLLKRLNLI
jgi:zinc transporter